MKHLLIFLTLFSLAPTTTFAKEPIKVYFAAKVRSQKQQEINKRLQDRFFSTKNSEVFLPQEHLQSHLKAHHNNNHASFSMDKDAINWCDILFLVSPYGKDCSWTVGYAEAIDKFTVVYLTESDSLDDVLVISSADMIATDNKQVYDKLLKHPALSKKSLFIFENDNFEESLICLLYANKSKQARFLDNASKYNKTQSVNHIEQD